MNNSLLPPSSTAWMRSAESASARLSAITVALRTLWTPTACPVDLLPYLAWALSVDRWDKSWPAAKKVAAIQQSYWLHRRKGTRAAVRRVIEDMGFSATFAEWFDVGDEPGTFRLEVDVNDIGLTPKTLDELNRLVADAKPVSRHLSRMTISTSSRGNAWAGLALFDGDVISVYPPGYQPDGSIRYDAQQYFSGSVTFSGK
ncbi:phage tail protein I [Klebsiella grimontii]|uniref:phage tail protein I n=1 Tax=Klebsiella grimontii TaxID=2058152 RepID=UPI0012B8883E|nr:phage tail protein I [Klebsiella grimontii]